MSAPRGFVLVNALVLVAALAAAALLLLGRAEDTRVRLEAGGQAAQLAAYLDGAEALALVVLDADAADPEAPYDHPGEAWAQPIAGVMLDRGRMSGQIRDLQGRFNLNLLARDESEALRAVFGRLIAGLGLAPQTGEAILAHLSPGGPERVQAYASAAVPTRPVGGALTLPQQLAEIPALGPRDLARLADVVTVLPEGGRINVNTAPAAVLAAFLPTANTAALAALVQRLRRAPLTSVEAFIAELGGVLDEAALAEVDPDRFTVRSDWFELSATVTLEDRRATRVAVLRRRALPQGAEVAYRLDDWTR